MTLTAGDALLPRLVRVADEDRPQVGGDPAGTLYAVFATGDKSRFLGLVSSQDIAAKPHRIFADLLPARPAHPVTRATPLEEVFRRMEDSGRWCLPVVDDRGCFIGAVTRTRLLEILLESHRRLLAENRRLTRRMFGLQEQERRHLARELHDELGQYIAALRTNLECLRQLGAGRVEIQHQVKVLDSVLDHFYAKVRTMMRRLRPELLEQLGLADTLRELVDEHRQRHPGIAFELDVAGDLDNLSDDHAIGVYRIVQECLTNAVRHSGARTVRVCLCCRRECRRSKCRTCFRASCGKLDRIRLTVRDDGKGLPRTRHRTGFGLLGIRERVEALHGEFRLASQAGLCVAVELPLEETNGTGPAAAGG